MAATVPALGGHCLNVIVVGAKDLKATNYFSAATDAFCILNLRNQIQKSTQVQRATSAPVWNETIIFSLPDNPEEETLFITVWGKHLITKNTFLGRVEIPVCLVIERDHKNNSWNKEFVVDRWFKLLPKAGLTTFDQVNGWIQLRFKYSYVPFVSNTPPLLPPGSMVVYSCPKCTGLCAADFIERHAAVCNGTLSQEGILRDPSQLAQGQAPMSTIPPAYPGSLSQSQSTHTGAPSATLSSHPPVTAPSYPTNTSPYGSSSGKQPSVAPQAIPAQYQNYTPGVSHDPSSGVLSYNLEKPNYSPHVSVYPQMGYSADITSQSPSLPTNTPTSYNISNRTTSNDMPGVQPLAQLASSPVYSSILQSPRPNDSAGIHSGFAPNPFTANVSHSGSPAFYNAPTNSSVSNQDEENLYAAPTFALSRPF